MLGNLKWFFYGIIVKNPLLETWFLRVSYEKYFNNLKSLCMKPLMPLVLSSKIKSKSVQWRSLYQADLIHTLYSA